jgi:hypothetical protein
MIKIDTIGREWCLPCADSLEVEGVIVERDGECLGCERKRIGHKDKDPMLMDNEEFADFIKDMTEEYANAWTFMRFESLVNQLMRKFMNQEKSR